LNGFNSTDIKQRLAQLSPDEIASLHEGAINNPRVGPDSQVAKMTGNAADAVEGDRPLTPDEISAAQTIFGNTIDYGAVTLQTVWKHVPRLEQTIRTADQGLIGSSEPDARVWFVSAKNEWRADCFGKVEMLRATPLTPAAPPSAWGTRRY
jgi:hypothetical protein